MISYSEALFDWVEANHDYLREVYKEVYKRYPDEEDMAGWSDFCQRQFDDHLAYVEDHGPLEDR